MGVTQSIGRVGSCFDDAVSEAFNSVLKVEYVHRHTFATRTEARLRIATWITGFYNTHRLHNVCGYQSPIDYEQDHRASSVLELAARKSAFCMMSDPGCQASRPWATHPRVPVQGSLSWPAA
ncbi:integrase core domain-containing protein [Streptomyces sp. NPDC001728]|uniref:integrase core domain-containing protein n=1 Tax=Streptomyces sp. NPDC001728 TaxID=3154396 RepID=UPI0033225CF4